MLLAQPSTEFLVPREKYSVYSSTTVVVSLFSHLRVIKSNQRKLSHLHALIYRTVKFSNMLAKVRPLCTLEMTVKGRTMSITCQNCILSHRTLSFWYYDLLQTSRSFSIFSIIGLLILFFSTAAFVDNVDTRTIVQDTDVQSLVEADVDAITFNENVEGVTMSGDGDRLLYIRKTKAPRSKPTPRPTKAPRSKPTKAPRSKPTPRPTKQPRAKPTKVCRIA